MRSRPSPAHPAAARSSPTISRTSNSTSPGDMTGRGTAQLRQAPGHRIPLGRAAARSCVASTLSTTYCQNLELPKVSATRCTRSWSVGLTTEWRRQLSNNHASPAAMWTLSSPQSEGDFGPRDHGNVETHALKPVIARVRVLGHVRPGTQAHEPGPAPHDAKAGEHLPHVRARLQMRRRPHDAAHAVVFRAVHADQADRRISFELLRDAAPTPMSGSASSSACRRAASKRTGSR